jgi:hypothetical protein
MHCPKCGQLQVSEETRFCSRCGLLLTGIAEVVARDGIVEPRKTSIAGNVDSPKRRGIKQGAFLFLLTFVIVPILALISMALDIEPFLPVIGVFLFGVGGLLKVVYALMFQSGGSSLPESGPSALPTSVENRVALPPSQSIPASAYGAPNAGSWRDTNDLQRQPGSVTDSTTKLLQKEEGDQ